MTAEEKKQLFTSFTDCYADTSIHENDGSYTEGEVIMAITEDSFYKAIGKLDAELKEAREETLNFTKWYSGMDKDKVERAYKRYLKEDEK